MKDIHRNLRTGALRRGQLSMEECHRISECEMIPKFVPRYASRVWCQLNCVDGNGKNCEAKCKCATKGNFILSIIMYVLAFDFDRI